MYILYSPLIAISMYISESLSVDLEKGCLPVTKIKPKSACGCNFVNWIHIWLLYTCYFIKI